MHLQHNRRPCLPRQMQSPLLLVDRHVFYPHNWCCLGLNGAIYGVSTLNNIFVQSMLSQVVTPEWVMFLGESRTSSCRLQLWCWDITIIWVLPITRYKWGVLPSTQLYLDPVSRITNCVWCIQAYYVTLVTWLLSVCIQCNQWFCVLYPQCFVHEILPVCALCFTCTLHVYLCANVLCIGDIIRCIVSDYCPEQ